LRAKILQINLEPDMAGFQTCRSRNLVHQYTNLIFRWDSSQMMMGIS